MEVLFNGLDFKELIAPLQRKFEFFNPRGEAVDGGLVIFSHGSVDLPLLRRPQPLAATLWGVDAVADDLKNKTDDVVRDLGLELNPSLLTSHGGIQLHVLFLLLRGEGVRNERQSEHSCDGLFQLRNFKHELLSLRLVPRPAASVPCQGPPFCIEGT